MAEKPEMSSAPDEAPLPPSPCCQAPIEICAEGGGASLGLDHR